MPLATVPARHTPARQNALMPQALRPAYFEIEHFARSRRCDEAQPHASAKLHEA